MAFRHQQLQRAVPYLARTTLSGPQNTHTRCVGVGWSCRRMDPGQIVLRLRGGLFRCGDVDDDEVAWADL